jgi:iron(II)-dependent oxidoreductase
MTTTGSTTSTVDAERIARELERARARTLGLMDGLSAAEQQAQVSPLMSPFVWDLAHIGNYEELWLLRSLDGRPPIDPGLDELYNAFEHPRWQRSSLPILGPREARDYLARVRDDVLDLLGHVDFADPGSRLLADGFVYGMVLQHEHQHDETVLATHQLRGDDAGVPFPVTLLGPDAVAGSATEADHRPGPARPDMQRVAGGVFTMGASTAFGSPWAYDNERSAHEVDLPPFLIDTVPVTNRRYLEFIAAGGYEDARLWTLPGWDWRTGEQAEHPQFWRAEGDGAWSVLRFGECLDLIRHLDEPVQHVCWYEADAFARWAGKRLPTEAEWEKAATWHPRDGQQAWPWGDGEATADRTNLGQRRTGPDPITSHPAGASPSGCIAMIGDVWEWTSSNFTSYPGFEAWPYAEYSEVFWGDEYKVLRGGSWATDPVAARGTFRNWDFPIRRQIFAGFRCARDA